MYKWKAISALLGIALVLVSIRYLEILPEKYDRDRARETRITEERLAIEKRFNEAAPRSYSKTQLAEQTDISDFYTLFNSKTDLQQESELFKITGKVFGGFGVIYAVVPTNDYRLSEVTIKIDRFWDIKFFMPNDAAILLNNGDIAEFVGEGSEPGVRDRRLEMRLRHTQIRRSGKISSIGNKEIWALREFRNSGAPNQLFFDRTPVDLKETMNDLATVEELFWLEGNDYHEGGHFALLIQFQSGGTACAAEYRFMFLVDDKPQFTKPFGNCSDLPTIEKHSRDIRVSFPTKTGKAKTFVYARGKITEL